MKILVLPDSFKGSLSSIEFCEIAKNVLGNRPDVEVLTYPICDGGEGSVDCLCRIFDGKTLTTHVTDGNLFKKQAKYGYAGDKAFIAVSESSGLPNTMIKDPAFTTSTGMGEQILQAKHLGKKKIILCLGGSSTNDGGAGLVYALGGKFYNKHGQAFLPTGGNLCEIEEIELEEFYKNIDGLEFLGMSDVNNPLLGPKGCSYTFAPQKGAKTKEQTDLLEKNMVHFARITSFLGCDPSNQGAGAAGGLGYCVLAFLKGKLISGIDYILDAIEFEKIADDADYIISGEGSFDATSLCGKAVYGIVKRADKIAKKVTVFCGQGTESKSCNVISINDPTLKLSDNIKRTKEHLTYALRHFTETI